MAKRVFVIRHARTYGNDEKIFEGWQDGEISKLGVRQAQALGRRFRNIPIDAVYCSDLGRAKQTLDVMNLGLKPVFSNALRERNYGVLNGMNYEENRAFDDYYLSFRLKPFGGETLVEVRNRVIPFLKKIQSTASENVLVMTHHNPAMLMLCETAGTPLSNWRVFVQSSACVNELVREGKQWRIARVNDTSHLH